MLELTLNDEDEDGEELQQQPIILKTYNFKRPQFLKKLTNTYFKKSKQCEKKQILSKELVSQKLTFNLHKKNVKSYSVSSASSSGKEGVDGQSYTKRGIRLTKPFNEDMLEMHEIVDRNAMSKEDLNDTAEGKG